MKKIYIRPQSISCKFESYQTLLSGSGSQSNIGNTPQDGISGGAPQRKVGSLYI